MTCPQSKNPPVVHELRPTFNCDTQIVLAAQSSTPRCNLSAAKSFGRNDSSTSLTRRQSTLSACEREGSHYFARDSDVEATKAANPKATPRVVRTSTGMGEVADSTGTAGSENGAVRCVRAIQVEAGSGNSFTSSRCAGGERYVASTPSKRRWHSRSTCPFVLEDRDKMASLEDKTKHAVVKVSRKQSLIGSEYLN